MAPATKASRAGVKIHITKMINQVTTYETVTMTLRAANELEALKQNLKKYYETFQQHSVTIQGELDEDNAAQKDYDEETDCCIKTEEEVHAARTTLKTKLMEWEIIRRDEELDKAVKREQLRDKERDDRTQLMLQ